MVKRKKPEPDYSDLIKEWDKSTTTTTKKKTYSQSFFLDHLNTKLSIYCISQYKGFVSELAPVNKKKKNIKPPTHVLKFIYNAEYILERLLVF